MTEMTAEPVLDSQSDSDPKSRLKAVFWVGFFFFWLSVFTLFKLPDTKIKAHLNGLISKNLSQAGYSFNSAESVLSIGFGIHYTLKGVTISPRYQPQSIVRIDRLEVSPSLISLITGKISASISADIGKGNLSGSFGIRGSQGQLSLELKQVNINQSPLTLFLQGAQISSNISGTINLEGNVQDSRSILGSIDLSLSKIDIDKQSVSGFPIPKTQISGGKINIQLSQGKATFKNFSLGSMQNPTDDISGKIEGDMQIQQRFEMSTLNLTTHFNVAPAYLQNSEIFLVQSFIAAGKQVDGTYRFKIAGPLSMPSADPIIR